MSSLERRRKNNGTLPTTHAQSEQQPDTDGNNSSSRMNSSYTSYEEDSPLPAAAWGASSSSPARGRRSTRGGDRNSSSTSGLHQRHIVRRSTSGDRADEFEQGLSGHHTNSIRPSKFGKKRKKKYPCSKWIRFSLLAGIPAYLLLIYLFLKRMNYQYDIQRQINLQLDYTREEILFVRDLVAATQVQLQQRPQREVEEYSDLNAASKGTDGSRQERRQRTRPPLLLLEQMQHFPTTTIRSVAQQPRPDFHDAPPRPEKPGKLEEICGFMAQNAALENTGAFTQRDALSTRAPRVTRVLITGILTSAPAYKLALALKEQCNVQVIVGFDSMYPNSIGHRLALQEKMAVLTKFIPKMVRPIFLAYAGLDPLKHSKNFKVLEQTGEIDVLQTLNPTHILHFASYDPAVFRYSDPDWKNRQSPYVRVGDDERRAYDPAMYALRSGMVSMEQILASIATAPSNDRPHFIYASASSSSTTTVTESPSHGDVHRSGDHIMHSYARRVDEVLADFYYQEHGVYSVGLQLPNAVYGPGGHAESDLYQLFDSAVSEASGDVNSTNSRHADLSAALTSSNDVSNLDLLHVDDIVDGVISAMQYRPADEKPVLFEFSSGTALSLQQVHRATKQILDSNTSQLNIVASEQKGPDFDANREILKQALGWTPRVSLEEGLSRSIAWHIDHVRPYGGPPVAPNSTLSGDNAPIETGDTLLQRLGFSTCAADHMSCHGGRPFLPCASECSARHQCVPTIFDELVLLTQELTEECDIVLYTQDFDKDTSDLALQSEFMEDGDPLVCNFAFINSDSELVDNVVNKVPDSELGKLGFELTREDAERPGGMKARKHEKLNGRLLYRGWILIWAKNVPDPLPAHEKFLLKLAPGRLFHKDVKSAVYIDQAFGVSPHADDILFLVHEMHRLPWNSRVVKRKQRPKAKFMLPAEPQRCAVVLMSELKYQDSSDAERLSPDEKITTYEATRFMRYSNGEEPLGKEPANIKLQREFYDRLRASINPDHARGPAEPLHKFEMKHWVRSRWVAHDMVHEESRQLRCEWLQEHVHWGTDLDQLSFAYIMEKLEVNRKLSHAEPDEVVQKHLSEKTEMKKLLSDTFEWHALMTQQNKLYSPYEEMQILPYDMDYTDERELAKMSADENREDRETALFVRVISDRIMAMARKAWNTAKTVSPSKEEL